VAFPDGHSDSHPDGYSDSHFRRLERLYLKARGNEYFRPETGIESGRAEVPVEVRPAFFHAAAAAHGFTHFQAFDDAAFLAARPGSIPSDPTFSCRPGDPSRISCDPSMADDGSRRAGSFTGACSLPTPSPRT